MGTVSMLSAGENKNASQFYFTLRDDIDFLNGEYTVFGKVAEGFDTLTKINETYVDGDFRPFTNIRIKHTCILDDPFDDPPQLIELIPNASPEGKPQAEIYDDIRLEDNFLSVDELGPAELEKVIREKEAHCSAVFLECIGDIPHADVQPPENILFVCRLHPRTTDLDLKESFSRFGSVISAKVVRDYKTGESLCYSFIEFKTKEESERALLKMDNTVIHGRRIRVDFYQSSYKSWSQYKHQGTGRGIKCGGLNHVARHCKGIPSTRTEPQKHILKDGNSQRCRKNKTEIVSTKSSEWETNHGGIESEVKHHEKVNPKSRFDGETDSTYLRRQHFGDRICAREKDSKKPRLDKQNTDEERHHERFGDRRCAREKDSKKPRLDKQYGDEEKYQEKSMMKCDKKIYRHGGRGDRRWARE
ncbi:RNA recognition motif domain [Macleaya cordata]|uniref:Peptidyl-prolyl cis-trans isomerase n=1 Tax=Macleaya cordata TaxID=56857 RepID=A0A200R9Y0_MACCD|nr:RNA recognition motif domain [Macleaya cordata]